MKQLLTELRFMEMNPNRAISRVPGGLETLKTKSHNLRVE